MRWPCISRDTYDRHTQVLIDAQGALITQNEWLRGQNERLSDRIYTMKREGFVPSFDPKEYIDQPLTVDEQDAIHAQEDGS